jgi:hypothetical protein
MTALRGLAGSSAIVALRSDLLDLAGGPEAAALQGRGCAFEDLEARHLGIGRRGKRKGN